MSTLAIQRPAGDYDPLRDTRYPHARAAREQAEWLLWLEVGLKAARTIGDYSEATDRLLKVRPDTEFVDFTDGDLLTVIKAVPPASRKPRVAAFRSWFMWGVRTRRRLDNPCDLLPDFKQPRRKPIQVFSPAEELLLTGMPYPDGQLMTVLLEAGLRRAEAANSRSGDFNLDTRELAVTRGTKGGKHRTVVITQRLALAVDELRTLDGLDAQDYIWPTNPGGGRTRHDKPKELGAMEKWWALRLKRAGLPHRKLHTTRHTFATRWRERGLPLDDLQEMLGHESIQTTSDLYVHIQTQDIRKRMESLLVERNG